MHIIIEATLQPQALNRIVPYHVLHRGEYVPKPDGPDALLSIFGLRCPYLRLVGVLTFSVMVYFTFLPTLHPSVYVRCPVCGQTSSRALMSSHTPPGTLAQVKIPPKPHGSLFSSAETVFNPTSHIITEERRGHCATINSRLTLYIDTFIQL